MTKPFTRVATALVASMSVALFMSTQSQAQSPKSPYESPALVNAIMFHEIDAMTPTEQEAKSRYALSIIGFSVWFNSRCNFLPQNIETAIIAVYDQFAPVYSAGRFRDRQSRTKRSFAPMPQRASIECNVCVRIPHRTRSHLSAVPRRCNARGGLQMIRNRTTSVREFPELDHTHSYFAALIRGATTHRLS